MNNFTPIELAAIKHVRDKIIRQIHQTDKEIAERHPLYVLNKVTELEDLLYNIQLLKDAGLV